MSQARSSEHGATGLAPPASGAWFTGTDAADLVAVDLDGPARTVRVRFGAQWSVGADADRLGGAVMRAFSGAVTARLTSWADQHPHVVEPPPTRTGGLPRGTAESMAALSRAWRDLHEFRLRLRELAAAESTVGSRTRQVTVTVRAGHIARITLDPSWLHRARAADVEQQIEQALNAALAAIGALPDRAFDGCPDLRAHLATGVW